MLTCLTKDGEYINPQDNLDEPQLRSLSKAKQLVCKVCQTPVIYRRGSKIPHFAHYRLSPSCWWKPESDEHLRIKSGIYDVCKRQGIDCKLERIIPETKQIADVFIKPSIALEIQISSLSKDQYEERHKKYQSIDYRDYWYWGEKTTPRSNEILILSQQIASSTISFYVDWVKVGVKNQSMYFNVSIVPVFKRPTSTTWGIRGAQYEIDFADAIFWQKGVPDTKAHIIKNDIKSIVKCLGGLVNHVKKLKKRYRTYKHEWGYELITNYLVNGGVKNNRLQYVLSDINHLLERYGV
ncbi:competence protein CoiA [Chloroflexota bacterium]